MLANVFSFWIDIISTCVNFLFTLKINENPDITLGMFLLACAFIGVIIYLILGTDFFPGHISSDFSTGITSDYTPKHTYQPKHSGDFRSIRGKHVSSNYLPKHTSYSKHSGEARSLKLSRVSSNTSNSRFSRHN